MRIVLSVILILLSLQSFSQNGYVKLNNDSVITGYLRHYVSHMDGKPGIELWKTKNDKQPLKISKLRIKEYAIKKDTFAILRDFYPFEGEDYQVESIEAEVLIGKGNVKLYYATLSDYKNESFYARSWDGTMTQYGQSYAIYIVRDNENNLIGISGEKDKFLKSIKSVIGDNKKLLLRIENRELKFKDTEDIIRIYNKG